MDVQSTPFHDGELEAQRRAGVEGVAGWAAGFIRDHMPAQHRSFFADLPFVVVTAADGAGRPWVSILERAEGVASPVGPRRLELSAAPGPEDPLAERFSSGGEIGLLGIELATRRRNRLNGTLRATAAGYIVDVRQSFGNCAQYIRERGWHRGTRRQPAIAHRSGGLDPAQVARIAAVDTFFIGSGSRDGDGRLSDGYDASHRGGAPGFVRVTQGGAALEIPDYAGNNYFNTIGNLLRDPRVGVLFVDFETGGLLHITGRASIDWSPAREHDPDARRMIHVAIDRVIDRPGALSLRWSRDHGTGQRLKVVDKVTESDGVTSFHLAAADSTPSAPFQAGQHLPVALSVPGQPSRIERSYSLSGSPLTPTYRISVKREDRGTASRFLHDRVQIGDEIEAGQPSGDFVLPEGDSPVVLASAGVGITPMLSMLHVLRAEQPDRRVWFVHTTRNARQHAFAMEVEGLIARGARVTRRVHYSAPGGTEDDGRFDKAGRLTARDLLDLEAGAEADYMLCGPPSFLGDMVTGLEAGGVASDRIHFESFGPGG